MINFALILSGLGLLLLLAIFGYYVQEVKRRRGMEIVLRRKNERERLMVQIAGQIRQSLDIDEVLTTTVEEVQRFLQADRVLVYRFWPDGTGSATHETVLPPYPKVLDITFDEEVFPRDYHQAYALGKMLSIANVAQAEIPSCLTAFVQQFGVHAKLVVPIIQDDRDNGQNSDRADTSESGDVKPYLWGVLIAHQCSGPRQWQPWEIELTQELATQVAIAVQQSELYNQLQQLNTQLEARVQQRTTALATANTALQTEVAERKRTEIALRHKNDTLNALMTASPRAIALLDTDGNIKIWNPAAEAMFGWQEAEIIDRPSPILLEASLPNGEGLIESVLQGNTYLGLELPCHQKDGTVIDVMCSIAPLRAPVGQMAGQMAGQMIGQMAAQSVGNSDSSNTANSISGLVAVIVDITIQKQQAEELRLLQSVVVNTNDAVIITEAEPFDEPGPRILYVNAAFTQITGYQPSEVLGKTPRILQGPKTDRAELDRLRSALTQWQPVTVEVINYRKDGSEFWNEFSLVPVANAEGWYTHWIAVQRDTTRRKRLDEVRLALEREKELSTLKTHFFSMASHEFRTPLSTALAAAQVLENSQAAWEDTAKRLRNLHRIQDSVRNTVQLLDDILTINRAESGNLEFNPKPLALALYCEHFVEEMQLSAGDQHILTFEVQGNICSISLDEKLMRSILANLLSNAIKYSPEGGTVALTLVFAAEGVELRVKDNGIGIPPADQKHLFEPFQRGKNVRNVPGTGLGLMVVKKCVDLHEGEIVINSEVGVGTTCVVKLPLQVS